MGFYIRKGFNFGPLRLNLSRSGLGASFGVKGARIGIGPRGSYVHMGRGGLYYRQTLHFSQQTPGAQPPSFQPATASIDTLQEISSASAIGIMDSSATDLLQELNRVQRRTDLFPIIGLVGAAFFVRLLFLGSQWWVYVIASLAIVSLALIARNYDVTDGTAILNYSFDGDAEQIFSEVKVAFTRLAACGGVWHVDAAGRTSDWKRHAGVNSLESRTFRRPIVSRPRKVQCNIDVPTLNTGRISLYFFPDRLLLYDSSGVGAVSYAALNAQTGSTRFVEDRSVPSDAQQVGTTWRFVNRSGGPDRRFNNNRQMPILLYGELSLTSTSGLNELFQYSVPESGAAFAAAVEKLKVANPTTGYNATARAEPSAERIGATTKALIWVCLALMTALFFFLPWPSLVSNSADAQRAQNEELARQEQARHAFVDGLNSRFSAKNIGATTSSENALLTFQFTKEGPKAARRDGVEPFVKSTFFKRVLAPDTERTLCDLGFRTLSITRNGGAPRVANLVCAPTP